MPILNLNWGPWDTDKRTPPMRFWRWAKRISDAGWRFWLWDDPAAMYRHADEHNASLTVDEAKIWYLRNEVPNPYDILRANGLYGKPHQ